MKDTQSGEGGQAEKLRVAEELLEILGQYLVGPRSEEQTSGPIGGPMDEGEEDPGEGEEATGLGGSTQGQDAAGLHGGKKRIQKRKSVVAETQSGHSSKKGKGATS